MEGKEAGRKIRKESEWKGDERKGSKGRGEEESKRLFLFFHLKIRCEHMRFKIRCSH